jgi:hypothetical protein
MKMIGFATKKRGQAADRIVVAKMTMTMIMTIAAVTDAVRGVAMRITTTITMTAVPAARHIAREATTYFHRAIRRAPS